MSKAAFPLQYDDGTFQEGMTLRDYFAAKALQGFIGTTYEEDQSFKEVAESCYRYADAMMAERGG